MKGELTTTQIFLIIVFLIGLVVFIIGALWFKGYGISVITSLPGLIPELLDYEKKSKKKTKGLSLSWTAICLFLAVIFFAIVFSLYAAFFPQ
jgi:hypothetical protein